MVRLIKKVGLEICCGGIFGVGESKEQRVELGETLYRENVDAIPVNFHIPVQGTQIAHIKTMEPTEILKTIMMIRFTNPKAEVKVAAGRVHLRDLQSMIFYAGATGMMIGEYLTVAGRDIESDLQMMKDLKIPFVEDSH
jgi:biotin synthase